MVRYLSPDWIAAFAAAAEADEALRAASADAALAVQQIVTDGPDGAEIAYALETHRGTVKVVEGRIDDPDVTFEQDYATARAVSCGELPAQEAFASGRLRVHGDLDLLMEHRDTFVGLDAVFAALREQTDYGTGGGPDADPGEAPPA